MTAIVGVLCTDGVVIGTDSSATFTGGSFKTIEQPTEKLDLVSNKVIIAGTGQIGLGQRFKRIVESAWKENLFKGDPVEVGRLLCERGIRDFTTTSAPKGAYGALVAFPFNKSPHLCEFAPGDFQPELKNPHPRLWYTSMGSAQPITDPFMALLREVFWANSQPTVKQATFAVLWAIEHAIDCNPGGVDGPARLAVLQVVKGEPQASLLAQAELDEHLQAIESAKNGMRSALETLSGIAPIVPDVPKPSI
jgi:Proteasome subunit